MSEVIARSPAAREPHRGGLRARTWPARSPCGSTRRPSWPAPTRQTAEQLQQACHTGYFRPYTNPDVIGCELGGAVKNVIALAVGIAVGMGLGDNTRAMLITRGLAEISPARRRARRRPAHVRRAWPGWATWSPPAARRCRATARFGENLGRGMTARRGHRGHQADRRGREVLASPCWSWRARTVWRCRSPRSWWRSCSDGLEIGEAVVCWPAATAKPERYGV